MSSIKVTEWLSHQSIPLTNRVSYRTILNVYKPQANKAILITFHVTSPLVFAPPTAAAGSCIVVWRVRLQVHARTLVYSSSPFPFGHLRLRPNRHFGSPNHQLMICLGVRFLFCKDPFFLKPDVPEPNYRSRPNVHPDSSTGTFFLFCSDGHGKVVQRKATNDERGDLTNKSRASKQELPVV